MKVCRIYTGDDDESHFEDIDVELIDAGEIGSLSKAIPVSNLIFRENYPGYDYDWHNAPSRQFVFILDGEIEIETGNGEKRRFKGGDILLAEDLTGRGHRSRQLSSQTRKSIFVQLQIS